MNVGRVIFSLRNTRARTAVINGAELIVNSALATVVWLMATMNIGFARPRDTAAPRPAQPTWRKRPGSLVRY